jgi:hypothetical protein
VFHLEPAKWWPLSLATLLQDTGHPHPQLQPALSTVLCWLVQVMPPPPSRLPSRQLWGASLSPLGGVTQCKGAEASGGEAVVWHLEMGKEWHMGPRAPGRLLAGAGGHSAHQGAAWCQQPRRSGPWLLVIGCPRVVMMRGMEVCV